MFKGRDQEEPPKFAHSMVGDRLVLTLKADGASAPVSEWVRLAPVCVPALGQLISVADEARVGSDGQPLVSLETAAVDIAPEQVAQLDAASAVALGLPAPTPLALDLRPVGHADEDRFHIEVRWVRPGGQRARSKVQGAFLVGDGEPRPPT